ncbi:MAG: DUF3035 domain-containing protein [Kiloniellales bacterium]|nr:DUF3035 domain-containing protein [Kiloniellales bacterium]
MQHEDWKTALAVSGVLMLAACSGVQDQFSLTSTPPDEFKVTTRAPLAVPPDFNLRPPSPGEPRPQEGTATQQAKQVIFRATDGAELSFAEVMPDDGRSMGERALLAEAHADKARSDIRQVVDRESQTLEEDDGYLYDVLVFWRDDEPPGRIIDAEAEARRLQENAALGKPVTEGETPTIERKKKALLEGIF